jgi:hypothetical protein
VLIGFRGCGDALAHLQIVDPRHQNLPAAAPAFDPRQPLAVGRDGHLTNHAAAVQATQNLFNVRAIRSVLRGGGRNAHA